MVHCLSLSSVSANITSPTTVCCAVMYDVWCYSQVWWYDIYSARGLLNIIRAYFVVVVVVFCIVSLITSVKHSVLFRDICDLLRYDALQYNTIQYNTMQYTIIQYNTIQYNALQYNTLFLVVCKEHMYSNIVFV